MNDNEELAQSIAAYLAARWFTPSFEKFQLFMHAEYGVELDVQPLFEYVSIVEMQEASFEDMAFPTGRSDRCWKLDANGLRRVQQPELDYEAMGPFFRAPMLHFFTDGVHILTREWVGARLRLTRLLRIETGSGECPIWREVARRPATVVGQCDGQKES